MPDREAAIKTTECHPTGFSACAVDRHGEYHMEADIRRVAPTRSAARALVAKDLKAAGYKVCSLSGIA